MPVISGWVLFKSTSQESLSFSRAVWLRHNKIPALLLPLRAGSYNLLIGQVIPKSAIIPTPASNKRPLQSGYVNNRAAEIVVVISRTATVHSYNTASSIVTDILTYIRIRVTTASHAQRVCKHVPEALSIS